VDPKPRRRAARSTFSKTTPGRTLVHLQGAGARQTWKREPILLAPWPRLNSGQNARIASALGSCWKRWFNAILNDTAAAIHSRREMEETDGELHVLWLKAEETVPTVRHSRGAKKQLVRSQG